ncbi:MAG: glycosyltransferase family 2 protein [bacterium]
MNDSWVWWLVAFEIWMVSVWAFRHLAIGFIFWRTPKLGLKSPKFVGLAAQPAPLVSILMPCKDEEQNVAACARDLLAQTYPNFELILIDDRSTDRTGAVADEVAATDPRVQVLHLIDRPPGWTGKTYALKRGMEAARGSWILFVDADTRHNPDCLSIVMQWASDRQASMVSLLPQMRCDTFWERVNQPLCGIVLMRSFPLELVNADWSGMAFANGQYILIDRAVYDEAGGHESVRDKFVEDIYLARVVKQKLKKRVLTAVSPEICSTRMYTDLGSQICGWARIYFDAWGRSATTATWKIIEPLLFTQSAWIIPLVALALMAAGRDAGYGTQLLWLSLAHNLLMFTVIARLYHFNRARWQDTVWYPLSGLISDWIYLRVIRMCLTGQVTWRGTTYAATRGPGGGSIMEHPPQPVVVGGVHQRPAPVASPMDNSPGEEERDYRESA